MMLAIAALLLQIPAVPQNSISTVSAATAVTIVAVAPRTPPKAAASDDTEPVTLVPTSGPPFPGLSAGSALTARASLSPSQDRSKELRHREWLLLGAVQHSAATFDAWSTREAISSSQAREMNPILRPFAGNASLYGVIQVGPGLFDYLGRRMMTSQHGWVRRTWWIPQTVSSVVFLASGAHNLSIP